MDARLSHMMIAFETGAVGVFMFYEMLHDMPLEMAFVAFAMWVAMTALGRRQIMFRWSVIGSALLFGIASYFGEHELAIALQLASLSLLLLGWICKVRWQIRCRTSERSN